MAAAKTAIASTQQQGEGDAFVLQGLSNPVNIMAGLKKQKDEGDQQKLLLKNKQEYDTQKSFYDQLTALNTLGIRTIDLPRVNQEIDGLIKEATEAKMQGKNPFDLGNPAEYMNLMGKYSKIQAMVDASKTLQKQIIAAERTLSSDKKGEFDQQKGRVAIDYTGTAPLEDVLGATINIPLAELKFGEILDKTFGDNIKEQLKIAKEYSDKNMVEEANKVVEDIKKSTLVSAITIGDPYIKDGRISNSDVLKQANDWVTQWVDKALYNPNKDEDQKLAEKKAATDEWYKKQKVAQGWEDRDFRKSAADKFDTNAEQKFFDITNQKRGEDALLNEETPYTALNENGEPELKDGNPVRAVFGKILSQNQTHSNGTKGFTVQVVNPITGKVMENRFIPVYDKDNKPIIKGQAVYDHLQEKMLKKKERYVGDDAQQVAAGSPTNVKGTATTTQGVIPVKKKEDPKKKEINKADIPAKAKAAGYTVEEYTKLLKSKGITIK
jgi:hypothetical protein